jgi:hypothetical protein
MREETKVRREQGRHKICPNCQVEFCSLAPTGYRTPREVACTKECAYKYGVQIRYDKGSYIRTKEAIKKDFATKASKNPEHGKKWAKTLQDRKDRGLGNYDKEKYKHWSQTPKGRQKISETHKGREVSAHARKLMSERMKKLLHDNPEKVYSNANGGKRIDLNNQYFRSNWEANYARILNEQNISWQYEPETFDLSDGTTYTPDFKIGDNKFVEIKGWYDKDSRQKISLFLKEYPQYELDLIGESEYYSLRSLFKDKITEWEGK